MKPTPAELAAAAMELVKLDSESRVIDALAVKLALMATQHISAQRASTAIAQAARLLRNQQFVNDPGPASFMLRVRLTEGQRERLQILADRETGGDMSKYVRHVLFA